VTGFDSGREGQEGGSPIGSEATFDSRSSDKKMNQLIINRNEVLQGPSPACLAVLHRCKKKELCRYETESYSSRLIPQLAKKFGLAEDQIIVSYGAEDFLRFVFHQLRAPDTILTSDHAYGYYRNYATFRKIPLETFALKEANGVFTFDINDCLRQYKKRQPKLVLIASPNNPTGNLLATNDAKKILTAINPETLVVIDEAYEGFSDAYSEKAFLELTKQYPNLVLLRTFSKRYALAGLRIGYALCGINVKTMLNYQAPYLGMSPIIEDVALAALKSNAYYKKLREEIMRTREQLKTNINMLEHLSAYASHANFLAVRVTAPLIPAVKTLLENIPTLPAKFVSRGLLRVSIGQERTMRDFWKALKKLDEELLGERK
jgi:histidinol-phosphate aminotransferase